MGVNRGSGLHKRSILDKIYQLTGDVVASGLVVVLTGASGVGKGTVRKKLVERAPFYYSISATTRPPRPGERHGVDYWFVSRDEFLATREQGGFLEWAEYVGSFYGTLAAPVEAAVSAGRNVLLEIEVQGALQVAKRLPEAILVFLIPPSLTELERRLLVRGQDSPEKIQARLARAQEEMAMADSFPTSYLADDALDSFDNWETGDSNPPITLNPKRRVTALGSIIVKADLQKKDLLPVSGWIVPPDEIVKKVLGE